MKKKFQVTGRKNMEKGRKSKHTNRLERKRRR